MALGDDLPLEVTVQDFSTCDSSATEDALVRKYGCSEYNLLTKDGEVQFSFSKPDGTGFYGKTGTRLGEICAIKGLSIKSGGQAAAQKSIFVKTGNNGSLYDCSTRSRNRYR